MFLRVVGLAACLTVLGWNPGSWVSSAEAKGEDYTKQERQLSKLPNYRFHDRRMRKIFRKMKKEYKHVYAHASSDGYILPNEMKDLKFQRGFVFRLYIIDKRQYKVKKELRKFKRHCRKKYRRARIKARRAGRKHYMKTSDIRYMRKLTKMYDRYEGMMRRFACRYLKRYKRRYRRTHCRRRS